MTPTSQQQRQRALLNNLAELASRTARAEASAEEEFAAARDATESEFRDTTQSLAARRDEETTAAKTAFEVTRRESVADWEKDHAATVEEYSARRQDVVDRHEEDKEKAGAELREARWVLVSILDASKAKKKQLRAAIAEVRRRVDVGVEQVRALVEKAQQLLEGWGLKRLLDEQESPGAGRAAGGLAEMEAAEEEARGHLEVLKTLFWPRVLGIGRVAGLVLLLLLGALVPALFFLPEGRGAAVVAGAAFLGAVVLAAVVYVSARAQVQRGLGPFRQALHRARILGQHAWKDASASHREQVETLTQEQRKRGKDLARLGEGARRRKEELGRRRDEELAKLEAEYRPRLAGLKERRDAALREAEERCRRLLREGRERFERENGQARERHATRTKEYRSRHEHAWRELLGAWQRGVAEARAVIRDVNGLSDRLFPPWDSPAWSARPSPAASPPAVRFGRMAVGLAQLAGAVPRDERLRADDLAAFTLPALLDFPEGSSLLLRAADAAPRARSASDGTVPTPARSASEGIPSLAPRACGAADEGRQQAVSLLQLVMFRLMTAVPPGKVRFTIVDPVGLGDNFAAFMHLADFDEALVGGRIWTEADQIERQLADLTEHMENVIQKYLRNQFRSIEEYNADAGELAEPFRFLVVANFPAGFTGESARRLASIAASGPRCGVHTLVSVDARPPLPQGFRIEDLERHGTMLVWEGGRFAWKHADFGRLPLEVDAPPPADFAVRVLRQVGERAREARRVEVSFDQVAARPEEWWGGDSRDGIRVAIGRSGATKRQYLRLGEGTSQHALVAGKTGSGKSSLLHALVTNLALTYGPDEVELYLVDFKKGVEFKTYATHELAHARVVAVESEREFGLSVLQRLDAELQARGETFRALGVQNLADYRECPAAVGRPACPRVLLVVDEFQEFFVEDDRVAQEAALLLDRLVRQGRAFGIHVLLGSQTLGGAYSLARSTIDQMAVRIALQCSETDAQLILSKDNAAARLLSRPGEAIYNDAGGRVEGNDIFQVVWLPDDRRDELLDRVQELARQRLRGPRRPQIVFEGNAPADVRRNPLLAERLAGAAWPAAGRSASAWLGEAVAIKDPTAAVFRRQSGSNLLIVGQQDELALGMLATALLGLAAQRPPAANTAHAGAARFYVLDGTPPDHTHAGFLRRLARQLPHGATAGGWREAGEVIADVAVEVERREKEPDAPAPDVYLVIHGLQRLRDLRRGEDDFGLSRREERPSPPKQLATILREGPGLGVHVLVWCDTLNNVNRALERQSVREFEMRVLLQMSVADSSNLIDTPAASRLGLNRALFYSEEQGRVEKFRPYGLPPESWLEAATRQLDGRERSGAPDPADGVISSAGPRG